MGNETHTNEDFSSMENPGYASCSDLEGKPMGKKISVRGASPYAAVGLVIIGVDRLRDHLDRARKLEINILAPCGKRTANADLPAHLPSSSLWQTKIGDHTRNPTPRSWNSAVRYSPEAKEPILPPTMQIQYHDFLGCTHIRMNTELGSTSALPERTRATRSMSSRSRVSCCESLSDGVGDSLLIIQCEFEVSATGSSTAFHFLSYSDVHEILNCDLWSTLSEVDREADNRSPRTNTGPRSRPSYTRNFWSRVKSIGRVQPPKEGAPTYALWNAETDAIPKMLSTQSENIAQDSSGADSGQSATHLTRDPRQTNTQLRIHPSPTPRRCRTDACQQQWLQSKKKRRVARVGPGPAAVDQPRTGWAESGAYAPLAAKDTTVRWMRDETAWPAPHSRGRRGVERVQVVAAWNGRGSTQEEAAVAELTRGGTGTGRGYSIEGRDGTGMAWRRQVTCSGWCGGGAVVMWQVRRGSAWDGAMRGRSGQRDGRGMGQVGQRDAEACMADAVQNPSQEQPQDPEKRQSPKQETGAILLAGH
ncbi:hypothetical protein B0H14DRAFT_2598875 [Mycena olivaceomarginata]|nr:hypothetical protein B0H14DRAFT_2598875 [Mycena olivaceomarginata]